MICANKRHWTDSRQILHILTASISDSNRVLAAALSAGFRESGAVSLSTPRGNNVNELNPMVAIRSTGYSFDSIIGYQNKEGVNISLVDDTYLGVLVSLANSRFQINEERISRLRQALLAQYEVAPKSTKKPYWEDPEARRRRKREEGLARQQQLAAESSTVRQAASSEEAYDHAYDTL